MTKKKSPHEPVASNPFQAGLQALKQQLVDDDAQKKADAKARAEAAKARGELTARKPVSSSSSSSSSSSKRPSPTDVWRPANFDDHLFSVAMAGVTPMAQKQGGRVSARVHEASRYKQPPHEVRERQRRAEGGPALTAQWSSDGTVRAAWKGREFALEAMGRFSAPEETLDLHGMEPVQARIRVAEFVRTRRARGRRCVCVITGYGKNSPDGASVLLDAVAAALCEAPTAQEIDAFASAPEDLGGRGALLLSLKH